VTTIEDEILDNVHSLENRFERLGLNASPQHQIQSWYATLLGMDTPEFGKQIAFIIVH